MPETSPSITYGLERKYFVGPEIFDLETERIFSKHWYCAGRVEDFSPENDDDDYFRTLKIGDFSIIVVRRKDGSFAAFHNVCRHRGTQLLDTDCGPIKNSCVACPYHAWTYDLDGKLIGAPNMKELEGFDRSQFGLFEIGCVTWGGFVMIHLSAYASDFENDLAPIIERTKDWDMDALELGKTLSYSVAANWKIIFQNYSECYHCPTVHPNLNRLTPYRGATNDLTEGPILGGPMGLSDDSATVSIDGELISDPLPGLNEEQRRCVYYYTVFPNMFVSAHPDYVMIHQLDRISESETKVLCHFLVLPGTDANHVFRAVDQWDEVNRQDWYVCELTQKGVESPAYQPGPYSNLEPMLIAFDKHYRNVIAG